MMMKHFYVLKKKCNELEHILKLLAFLRACIVFCRCDSVNESPSSEETTKADRSHKCMVSTMSA